ncbi:MAG: hypothetical protein HC836_23145 [Richelia sp. RM2_1_2]|nr:hypothetical protein [Richelia sp. RM2_1_2]
MENLTENPLNQKLTNAKDVEEFLYKIIRYARKSNATAPINNPPTKP